MGIFFGVLEAIDIFCLFGKVLVSRSKNIVKKEEKGKVDFVFSMTITVCVLERISEVLSRSV